MNRANRIRLFRFLLITSIILVLPIIFVILITLPYIFNKVNIAFPNIDISGDVQEYLDMRENKFPELHKDAKKKIIWRDKDKKNKSEYSLVFLHGGFATGRQQEETLVKIADKLNANLFISRLAGHGSGYLSTKELKAEDYLYDIAESVKIGKIIGEKVILMGFSAGGTFSLMAAKDDQLSKYIDYLVLVAPYTPRLSPIYFVAATGLFFKKTYEFNFPSLFNLSTDEWSPFWVNKFDRNFPKEFWKAMYSGNELKYKKTSLPLLIFYEEKDKVVKADGVKKIFNSWKGPKKIHNLNTNQGGFNYHDIIGILDKKQDNTYINEIHKWISIN